MKGDARHPARTRRIAGDDVADLISGAGVTRSSASSEKRLRSCDDRCASVFLIDALAGRYPHPRRLAMATVSCSRVDDEGLVSPCGAVDRRGLERPRLVERYGDVTGTRGFCPGYC
jgi:hypothetical protein